MKHKISNINICLGIMLIGFILELILPDIDPHIFRFPLNIIILAIVILCSIQYKGRTMERSIIVTYILMVFLIGVIPQDRFMQSVEDDTILRELGLFTITNSYPFIAISLMMLIALGRVILRHFKCRSIRSILLFSGHLGLWLIITAGIMSSSDRTEQRATVREGDKVGMGIGENGSIEPLNFLIQLDSFDVEYYPQGGAKHYASNVEIFDNNKTLAKGSIEVNKPLRLGNHFVYQTGYEQSDGKAISTLKIIYDPWFWVWYVGVGLLSICAIILIFAKR